MKRSIHYITMVLLMLHLNTISNAQISAKEIRGIVRDADSHSTLPGATIMVVNTEPPVGAVTDENGNFRISGLLPGRYDLKVTYLGYQPSYITEILVESGKQAVIQIELTESPTTLGQVEIRASSNKERAINPMAMISSRQLNMEEASRYAGGIDDPSRLATAFAGVSGSLSSNAIVIRGNAPKGLLWRMEGIEIPNPSHFANVSTFGGGGITALSSQMLGNSDFFTGAFPSEFGNALSGVFDMRIRTGNNEKREHTIKAGIIGLDFATEGPFKKGNKSSYLINYRYSTLSLISPLLPKNAQGLNYQDLSFKLSFPLRKSGTLTAWGLFSADQTGSDAKMDSLEWFYYQDMEKDMNKNRMGAIGINYRKIISERTYSNSAIAATGNFIKWDRERLHNGSLSPMDAIRQNDVKYTLSYMINHKFSASHTNRSGFNVSIMDYSIDLKHAEPGLPNPETVASDKGKSGLIQFYSQSKINLRNKLTFNSGFHSQWFMLNNEFTVEPRLSLNWKLNNKQSVSIAYGLHSRLEPFGIYLTQLSTPSGFSQPNKKLRLTKSHHLVFSYEHTVGPFMRILIEPYYQYLFDVPVIADSSFSMLNLEIDWFFKSPLVNSGRGRNAGIDFTCERFLNHGYYFLVTGSLFNAVYKGDDGITRNARFNKNFVFNILYGREWNINSKTILSLSGKFTLLGGDRYSPVNQVSSGQLKDVVYDETSPFTQQEPSIYYVDFSASWKRNKKNYSSTWSFQFINLLFQKEFYGHRYNLQTGNVEDFKEMIVIPSVSYRIDF